MQSRPWRLQPIPAVARIQARDKTGRRFTVIVNRGAVSEGQQTVGLGDLSRMYAGTTDTRPPCLATSARNRSQGPPPAWGLWVGPSLALPSGSLHTLHDKVYVDNATVSVSTNSSSPENDPWSHGLLIAGGPTIPADGGSHGDH